MNIDVDSRQSADFPRPAHAVALLSPARAQRRSISPSYHRKPTSRKVQGRGFQGPVKVREVPRRGARSLAVGETDGQGVAQESIPPGPKILWPAFLAPVGNDLRPPGRHPTSTLTWPRRPPSRRRCPLAGSHFQAYRIGTDSVVSFGPRRTWLPSKFLIFHTLIGMREIYAKYSSYKAIIFCNLIG